jgi:hypothetical protein
MVLPLLDGGDMNISAPKALAYFDGGYLSIIIDLFELKLELRSGIEIFQYLKNYIAKYHIPCFFSSLRLFSFRCLMQHVMIISFMITKSIEPSTIATIITRGTVLSSLALFSDAARENNLNVTQIDNDTVS